tara:strand:+ start:1719 stop:1964 length:246 start_codon:yes stop_codon:yes gene_type:complete
MMMSNNPMTKKELEEVAKHLDYEKWRYVAIIQEICAIIYFQMSLKEQDAWLNDRIHDGIWNIDLCEDEEFEKGFKKVGEEE